MKTVEIDLTSDECVEAAVEEAMSKAGGHIASVIHLAAYYDTMGEDNPKDDAVTVQGTVRLFQHPAGACAEGGRACRSMRILHLIRRGLSAIESRYGRTDRQGTRRDQNRDPAACHGQVDASVKPPAGNNTVF